jgi:hypothetical protein
MSAKEKSDELYWKYYQLVADCSHPEEKAKECALIVVDEILSLFVTVCEDTRYWTIVKQEIENL